MKKVLLLIVIFIYSKNFAQNNSKIAFQKNRYDLAVSYYAKSDYKKAIDLFYIASRIKPDNEIGKESVEKVDTLKALLRENIMTQASGTWKMIGDKPIWAIKQTSNAVVKDFDEIIEINQDEILFFELNKKTKVKKSVKSEKLTYYNEDSNSLFSNIILSDGSIWNCTIDEKATELHVINVGKKTENGFEKIESDNKELFFVKVK